MIIEEAIFLISLLILIVLLMGLQMYYDRKEIAIDEKIERELRLQIWCLKMTVKVQECEIKVLKAKTK